MPKANDCPPPPANPEEADAIPPPEASPLAQRLCATPETLELAHSTNPQLTETLGQLLFLLRVFSFS